MGRSSSTGGGDGRFSNSGDSGHRLHSGGGGRYFLKTHDRIARLSLAGTIARVGAGVGAGTSPQWEDTVDALGTRLDRLSRPPLPRWVEAMVVAAAVGLLAVPTVLLLAPAILVLVQL